MEIYLTLIYPEKNSLCNKFSNHRSCLRFIILLWLPPPFVKVVEVQKEGDLPLLVSISIYKPNPKLKDDHSV